METFSTFSQYSCLKPNCEKCKIAGIRVLKSVKMATCGIKCFDLCKNTIQITNVHISYNAAGLEIIILQWWDMLSNYARIYIGHFSFKSVNKFFYNIIKTLPKFPHFVARSCADCTRGDVMVQ